MSETLAALPSSDLVLGRYRPLRPLGSGGSGSVWLARDERAGVDVALKVVPREGNAGSRAEREAAAAARLRHPRCLRAYTLARDDRHVYIAYEYVAGRTLRQALRAGELDDHSTVEAGAQILEGLAHAHAHGIVHRDVKPANVLLEHGGDVSVRLLDFGLAQLVEAETLTAAGDVPGTLAYISPERLRNEPATAAADIWSVGALLWEALAGSHPFWTGSVLETARKIEGGAPSLAEQRPDLPKRLVAAVDRMLASDPARRPSAAKLAGQLRLAYRERERRPVERGTLLRRDLEKPASAALAAVATGWSASALPFYPGGWAPTLAVLAAVLTLARARLGLAFALAVPVFPLGNFSLAAALVYATLATAWLAFCWRDARRALFFTLGPLLAAAGSLALLPLLAQAVRDPARRAIQVLAAVFAAGTAAAARGEPLPLVAAGLPRGLDLRAAEDPRLVLEAVWRVLAAEPALGVAAIALAAAACVLPFAARRGAWALAGLGAFLLAATLLPAPGAPAAPLVAAGAVMCLALVPELRLALAGEPRGAFGESLAAAARLATLARGLPALVRGARLRPLPAPLRGGDPGRR